MTGPAAPASPFPCPRAYDTQLERRLPALRSPGLRAACTRLTTALGAGGAKFTGAGGDGSVVALFDDEAAAVRAAHALHEGPDLTAWYCPLP